ncbi:MAG: exo-alpha-sialidase [Lachnospiraceae bacterium]|nr:exo-alpha-sialidase [Lachnospiraceae bacterium]
MDNANKMACELLVYPNNAKYDEDIRQFQGCPTIAVTQKGRIFVAWYSGGTGEPDMENYNLMIYSDDNGKSWSKPVLVIPSNKERFIHALDIQLWISPQGKLYVFWVQNNTELEPAVRPEKQAGKPLVFKDGYMFNDFRHAEWVSVCDDPDAEILTFSEAKYVDIGFLRCKPLVLKDGRWIQFNYDQESDCYGYSISENQGELYQHYYGAEKLSTNFDETMAYEKEDGSIRMFARCSRGRLAESISYDGGFTWQPARLTDIVHADSRFFVARTPSGRVLLVKNDHEKQRTNLTVCLSEDDGYTWNYQRCIDNREQLSYPDADFFDGKIYLVYDRERTGAKEILFTCFAEENLMDENYEFKISVVSRPEK